MSDINHQNQMNSYYPFMRKTIFWYKKIEMNVIQMLLLNCVQFIQPIKKLNLRWHYNFHISILSELLSAILKPQVFILSPKEFIPKTHEIGNKEQNLCKRCICAKNKNWKDTENFCSTCPGGPSLCLEPCLIKLHL